MPPVVPPILSLLNPVSPLCKFFPLVPIALTYCLLLFSSSVHAIRGSRIIFQRMRNYSIYACAVTIRIVVCFAILAFAYKFDFPPFMVLIIALLNDGTIMTLSVDRVLPSNTPDAWDLAEIFAYAVAYGLYLTLST